MKTIFLICNAHLDPVWQWEWEEGAAETLSTFRIAAKFCREFDGFVFNHNEALLYKWIEEYEPELFNEISALVKEGKWHIMGGWHLQPDCNMPSGEAFVRQIKSGRRYFLEKFGVWPTTAINFDPFGHNRGLVQIMRKCGYDSYMFMRPFPSQLQLPAETFKWVGFDGSYVYAQRTGSYNSPKYKACQKINDIIAGTPENGISACLWGVGNHGGGPSRRDLEDISVLQKECKEKGVTVLHSTPEEFFVKVAERDDTLPEFKNELSPSCVGCYTSTVRVKQAYRQLESFLFSTEKTVAAACANGLMDYPEDEFKQVEYDLLTVQFHDMLPGSSIQEAEDMALRQLSHGKEILTRVRARAFFKLSSGQKEATEDAIPIMVFNPHPYPVEGDFVCEMMLWDQNWNEEFSYPQVECDGVLLPTQSEKERSSLNLDWRKKVVFHATLKPMEMNRFDCKFNKVSKRPAAVAKDDNDCFYLENSYVTARISKHTGFIESYKVDGTEMLKAPCTLTVYNDDCDPWGMNVTEFNQELGRFKLMSAEEVTKVCGINTLIQPVRPIESGAVRTTIEAMLSWNGSRAVIRYTLSEKDNAIDVNVRVNWSETQKLLRFNVPTCLENAKCFGQVAYGIQQYEQDIRENCAQKYVYLNGGTSTVAVLNDGTYGFQKENDTIKVTLMRSAAYCAHPINDREILVQDRYTPHMEQGERIFNLKLLAGESKAVEEQLPRVAMLMHETPMALSFYPDAKGKKPDGFIRVEGDSIEIPAIKNADDGNGYMIRLFNPFDGVRHAGIIARNKKMGEVTLKPFEIKTYRLTDTLEESDLLEGLKP